MDSALATNKELERIRVDKNTPTGDILGILSPRPVPTVPNPPLVFAPAAPAALVETTSTIDTPTPAVPVALAAPSEPAPAPTAAPVPASATAASMAPDTGDVAGNGFSTGEVTGDEPPEVPRMRSGTVMVVFAR